MHQSAALKSHVGKHGEQIATRYLQQLGYKIYATNVRIGHDEIDIVCYSPNDRAIIFAEVKARSRTTSYSPWLNITRKKRHALFRAARAWVQQHKYAAGYRIDVVCVVGSAVTEHIREISS